MAVHKEGDRRCSICSRLNMQRCFCHAVNDTRQLEELRSLLQDHVVEAVDTGHARLDRIKKKSILLADSLQADRIENKLHIEFEPQDGSDRVAFSKLVRQELELHLSERPAPLAAVLQGSLEERRTRLCELTLAENEIDIARCAVGRHDRANDIALKLAVGDTIPCVLHVEMRVGEKLF